MSKPFDRSLNRKVRASPYSRTVSKSDNVDHWKHDKHSQIDSLSERIQEGLHYEISQDELKDLFEQIGPTTKVSIRYDRSGRSTGSAIIIYANESDANLAKQEYDGANAKGKPIRISFGTLQPPKTSSSSGTTLLNRIGSGSGSLSERLGAGGMTRAINSPPLNAPKGPSNQHSARPRPKEMQQGNPSRGHSTGRRSNGPKATAESLDAELDAFMKTPK